MLPLQPSSIYEAVITCDELSNVADGLRFEVHLFSVHALWPNKGILRELRRAIVRAELSKATTISVRVDDVPWVIERMFNLLIGNGFRWDGKHTFTRKV
jgi:hypothetical protein